MVVADPLEAGVGMDAPVKGMDAALADVTSIEPNAAVYSAIRSSAWPIAFLKVTVMAFPFALLPTAV